MITPAPTTRIDSKLCRGVLDRVIPATATAPEHVVVAIPGTNYQLYLVPTAPISAMPGHRIIGTVRVSARRIDVTQTGGRFVEPVFGRPRRVQGTVIAIEGDSLVVNAGVPIWVKPTDPRQQASSFAVGQFVGFDALDGGTFTQG